MVRSRLILTDIEDWKAVVAVRTRFCRAARPVDTIMAVSRFVNPDWLVEIELDAILHDADG